MVMRSEELAKWLIKQTEERGWSFRELGRRADLSSSAISGVVTGKTLPGWDFCLGVSQALGVQPEWVFRKAGLLPALPPAIEEENEAITILRELPAQVRAVVMTMLRAMAGRGQSAQPAVSESHAPYKPVSDLEQQLLDTFRQLDTEGQQVAFDNVERLWAYSVRIIGEDDDEEKTATNNAA